MRDEEQKVLIGWKQIAGFLGVSVGTAKRYVKKWGMPLVPNPPIKRPIATAEAVIRWLHHSSGKRKKITSHS